MTVYRTTFSMSQEISKWIFNFLKIKSIHLPPSNDFTILQQLKSFEGVNTYWPYSTKEHLFRQELLKRVSFLILFNRYKT